MFEKWWLEKIPLDLWKKKLGVHPVPLLEVLLDGSSRSGLLEECSKGRLPMR